MSEENTAIPHISDEEKDWVARLTTGKTAKEISADLGMKEGTFAYKLNILRGKLNCSNSSELIAYFMRNKLIE